MVFKKDVLWEKRFRSSYKSFIFDMKYIWGLIWIVYDSIYKTLMWYMLNHIWASNDTYMAHHRCDGWIKIFFRLCKTVLQIDKWEEKKKGCAMSLFGECIRASAHGSRREVWWTITSILPTFTCHLYEMEGNNLALWTYKCQTPHLRDSDPIWIKSSRRYSWSFRMRCIVSARDQGSFD